MNLMMLLKRKDWDEYKGHKYCKGVGLLHISGTSTRCLESLLEDLKDIKLGKVKKFAFSIESKRDEYRYNYRNKGKYIENDA